MSRVQGGGGATHQCGTIGQARCRGGGVTRICSGREDVWGMFNEKELGFDAGQEAYHSQGPGPICNAFFGLGRD